MATRATIRGLMEIRADNEGSTFPSLTQKNTIVDQAAAHVWRKLVHAGWKPDRVSISITANGAPSYVLSVNTGIIHSVWRVEGGNRIPLTRVKPEELPGYLSVSASDASVYDIFGGVTGAPEIEFYPVPSSGTYEVRYTRRFPGFAADGDFWYGPDGSDELIAIEAAMQCVGKEGDDLVREILKDEWTMKYQELCESAAWYDSQGQQTVRDVRTSSKLLRAGDYMVSEGWV